MVIIWLIGFLTYLVPLTLRVPAVLIEGREKDDNVEEPSCGISQDVDVHICEC